MINIRLAELMGRKKMKQRELAELTKIRPNTISAMWHGTAKRIEIEHIDELCKALDCTPGELFEYERVKDQYLTVSNYNIHI